MTIFLELVKAASTVGLQLQTIEQTDEQYLKSLAIAIAQIDQPVFDALSKDAQSWYQRMTEAIKLPFDQWPRLPGFKDEATRVFSRVSEKNALATENGILRHAGIVNKVREVVMMNPMLTARQVQKLLDATSCPGVKFEVVSVITSETKACITLARSLGFWRDKSIYEGQPALTEEQAEAITGTSFTSD